MTVRFSRLLTTTCLTALALAGVASVASANPVDGTVSAGSAAISSSGNTLTVTQTSDKAVIDWRGFDIGAGETTKFVQPGSGSIALNRVNSTTASHIDGALTANGNVIIINQNGVMFGAGAKIDVNGLIATTADIDNDKFMNNTTGKFAFDKAGNNPNAVISNEGQITAAQAGLVGLVAPNVINNGIITAKLGRVHLASGDTATVDLYGDGLIEVAASDALNAQLVKNTGVISADGGKIALTAAAGRQVVNSLVSNTGTLSAQTVSASNGVITISNATVGGTAYNSGTITAKGIDAGTTGGSVSVLADNVMLDSGTNIDASGTNGGGTVLIGGDIHGTGAQTAQYTTLAQNAIITADATSQGDGGKIILWADQDTTFAGNISAKGGVLGGNGGFLETSGANKLTATGNVNLSAPTEGNVGGGSVGTWLLDPTNITIYNRNYTTTATDNSSTFLTSYLEAQSASANISLVADTNLTLDLTFGGVSDTLTVAANHNISLTATSGNISSASAGTVTTSGTGTISLTAGGTIDLGTNLVTLNSGGNVTTTSVGNTKLGAINTTGTGDTVSITVTGAGNGLTTAGAIATGAAGNITLTADDMTLGGNLSGTGTLTIQPNSLTRNIQLAAASGSYLGLTATEVGYFVDGWSGIVIGRSDTTVTTGMNFYIAQSETFNDPVTFKSGAGQIQLSNTTLTGNGNASFTFLSSWSGSTNLYAATITTQGGNIDFSNAAVNIYANGYTNSFTSNGGNIYLKNSNNGTYTINSGNGNVYFSANPGGLSWNINTGTGLLSYGTAITSMGDATLTTGTLATTGTWTGIGNLTLTSPNSLTLPAITTVAGKTVNVNVTGAGSSITTSGAIATGAAGSITLTADDLILGGNLSGTGTLTLKPNSSSRPMYVNYGSADGTNLNLSTTEIGYLVDGWTSILLGKTGGGVVSVGASTWTDPVSFSNATYFGALTGTGNASFTTLAGNTDVWANITTAGGAVTFYSGGYLYARSQAITIATGSGNVTLGTVNRNGINTAFTINSGNGNISLGAISGTATSTTDTYNAGTGTISFGGTVNTGNNITASGSAITFNGAWGGSQAPGTVTLTSTSAMALPAITATSLYLSDTGAVTQTGALTLTNLSLAGTGGAYTLTNASNVVTNLSGNTSSINFANGNSNLSVGTVNSVNGITTTGNTTLSTGTGTITTTQAIAVGAGSLNLTSDDVVLGGNLSGTGTLTFLNKTASRVDYINAGTADGTNWNLSTTEIGYLTNGWSSISLPSTSGVATIGASSWLDPVIFNFKASVAGALTGTDDASFTFASGSNIDLSANITTAGGKIDFSNSTYVNPTGGSTYTLSSGGGNISMKSILVSQSFIVNSGGGNISVSSTINNNASGKTLTFNAGTGTVAFGAADNSSANISATGNSLTFNGAWGGGATTVGNVTLTSVNSISLPAITTTAGSTVNVTVSGAGNSITTTGAIATGASGIITLASDDLILGGNLSGTGTLTLQPTAVNRTMNINAGTADGTNWNLSQTELAYLVDGWSSILIGRSNSTGTLTLSTYISGNTPGSTITFTDPTTFRSAATSLYGFVTGTDNASFTFTGGSAQTTGGTKAISTISGNIDFSALTELYDAFGATIGSTSGNLLFSTLHKHNNASLYSTATGNISFSGTIYSSTTDVNSMTMSALGGTISFGGTVNTGSNSGIGNDFTVTANNMTFNGAWGGSQAIGNVSLTSTNSLTLPAITLTAGKSLSATVTGAGNSITTTNAYAVGTGGSITFTADDLILGGNLSGTGTITLKPNTASRNVCVNSSTGSYCASGNLGLSTTEIGYLVDGWSSIVIGRSDGAGTVEIGSGGVSFSDPVSFLNASRVNLFGTVTGTDNASLTFNASNGGWIHLGNNLTTAGQNINIITNSVLTDTNVTFTSNNGNISLSGGVVNPSDSTSLTLNAGTGTVTLPAITNAVAESSGFGLNVTAATITLGGAIGSGAFGGIGNVTLNSTNSISLPAITTLAGKTVSVTVNGAGNSIASTGTIATGTGGNITFTADTLGTTGNLSGTGTLTIQPYTLSRQVCVNYCGSTALRVVTANISSFVDGWSGIVIGRSDATSNLLISTATFTDPVTFIIGSGIGGNNTLTGTGNASFTFTTTNPYGNLYTTITTAGGNVTFNVPGIAFNSITTNGGNIAFSNGASLIGNVTLNAGTGTISFGGAINSDYTNSHYNLTANAASYSFNGAWNGTGNYILGNVSLTSVNSLTLPAITFNAGSSLSATVTGAGNSITTSNAYAVGTGGNITFTADDLILGGNLSGTGTLLLQPNSTSRYTCIGVSNGNCASNDFNLSQTEIGYIVNGWATATVGNAANTQLMYMQGSTATPVTFTNGSGGINIFGAFSTTAATTFTSSGQIIEGSTLTGTGSGSFTFGGSGYVNLTSSITTANQAVTFNDSLSANGGTITTNGGAVAIQGMTVFNVAGLAPITINTAGGNISFASTISQNTSLGALTGDVVTLNAGTGALSFASTINGAYDLSATANNITFGSAIGGTVALGNVTLNNVSSLTLPAISMQAGKTLAVTVSGAGNSITTTQAYAVGTGGNIAFTADDVILGGNLSGTGTLTLQNSSATRAVDINAGPANGTDYNLSTTELGYLVNGWNLISIGNTSTTALGSIGASSWLDPVVFHFAPQISGALTGTDNASFTFAANALVNLSANITTAGGKIDFSNTAYLNQLGGSPLTISSGGGDITIKTINGVQGLTVNSGGGNISILGSISSGTSGRIETFNAGTGTVSFGGTVNTAADVSATGNSISFNGTWGGSTALGSVSLTSTGSSLVLPTITAGSIFADAVGATSDITLASGKVLTASGSGNALTLVAGRNFINNGGSGALVASSGRWLVYATDPTDDTVGGLVAGGLANGFNRYSCTFSAVGACAANATIGATVAIPTSGNGLIYSYTPVLTATANATNVIYGNSVSLNGYSYTLTGYNTGEGADTVTGSLNGATSYAAGSDVGSYAINYASGALASALGYNISYANSSTALTAIARTITASLTGSVTKTYDGLSDATLASNNYSLSNVYGSDALTVTTTSGSYADANAGSGKNVTVTGLAFTGAKANDYVLSSTTTSGTVGVINQRALTIGANGESITYGDGNSFNGYTIGSGLQNGETITNVNLATNATSATSGNWNATNGTPWTITASGATGANGFNTSNYAITYTTGALTIAQKALTVGASSAGKTYDGLATDTATLSDDRITNDVFTDSYTSATYANANAGTNKTLSVAGITISGADAANYSFNTSAMTTATIAQRALTIGANNQSITYGDGNSLAGYTIGTGLQNGETITGVNLATNATSSTSGNWNATNGTPWVITASSATGANGFNISNYAITYNTGTLTIAQKALTIGASSGGKTYDGLTSGTVTLSDNRVANDVFTDSYSGATYADANAGTGKTLSVAGVSISGTDAANYSFNTTASTLADIAQRVLAVTANNQSITYGDGNTFNGYTIGSGLQNGETITGVNLATNATSATSGNWNATNGTPWVITASNATGANGFNASNYAIIYNDGALSISKKALTIGASSTGKVYDGLTTGTATLSDNRIANDVFTDSYTAANYSNANAGTGKVLTVTGISTAGADAANYSFNTSAATNADITKRALAVTASSESMTYGDGNTFNGYTDTGLQNGETITGVTLTTNATSSVSGNWNATSGTPWVITASNVAGGNGFNLNNYTVTYNTGTLAIAAKALTILGVTTQDKVYDGTTSAVANASSATFTGKLGSDNVMLNAGTLTSAFLDKNAGTNKTVYVSGFSLSGTDAANYTLDTSSFAGTTANITPRALTITATGIDKIYDGTLAASASFSDNRVAGDVFTSETYSATYLDKNVASGKTVNVSNLLLSGGDAGNYTYNTTAATTANITPKALTITADDASRNQSTPNPAFTVHYTGLATGDTAANILGLTIDSGASITSLAGTYSIHPYNATNANYTISFMDGTLTVLPNLALPSTVIAVSQNAGTNIAATIATITSQWGTTKLTTQTASQPLLSDTFSTTSYPILNTQNGLAALPELEATQPVAFKTQNKFIDIDVSLIKHLDIATKDIEF